MHRIGASVASAGQISGRARECRRAHVADDEQVLAAVMQLSEHYHAPSTSLITWQLARGGTVTASFQTVVRDALQRLHVGGQLSCVTHRGTQRWTATCEPEQPSA